MSISLIELWGHMGWFARGIVFVLLFMSVIVMTVAVRKLLELRRSRMATLKFSPEFSAALATGDFAGAERLVAGHPRSHLAAAFRRVFPALTFHSQDHSLSAVEIASVQRLIELNSLDQVARFRRGLGVLATIGATAPFVGLLGTTMGVITAFTGMSGGASAGAMEQITAGIAEALITTAFGLLVALPAVWLYNYFVNRIEFVSMEIMYATKEFMDFLLRYEAELQHATPGQAAAAATRTVFGI